MQRRILEEQDPRRYLDAAEPDICGRAPPRPIGLPIREPAGDVVIATQGIEVVLLVVIQRRLCPHPFPDRIRVVIDSEIEWVVVQLDSLLTVHSCLIWVGWVLPGTAVPMVPT